MGYRLGSLVKKDRESICRVFPRVTIHRRGMNKMAIFHQSMTPSRKRELSGNLFVSLDRL